MSGSTTTREQKALEQELMQDQELITHIGDYHVVSILKWKICVGLETTEKTIKTKLLRRKNIFGFLRHLYSLNAKAISVHPLGDSVMPSMQDRAQP